MASAISLGDRRVQIDDGVGKWPERPLANFKISYLSQANATGQDLGYIILGNQKCVSVFSVT